ncbi:MAG: helix-turn-helix domain-containing protein, partial [Patescibacteria group bacterium]
MQRARFAYILADGCIDLMKPSAFLKIGQASKALGVSIDTLRRWEKTGKISAIRTPGGTRLYSLDQLKKINPSSIESFQTSTISTEELLQRSQNQKWDVRGEKVDYEVRDEISHFPSRAAGIASGDARQYPASHIPHLTSLLSPKTLSLLGGVLASAAVGFFAITNLIGPSKETGTQTLASDQAVLAALEGPQFLEINSDTQINGALATEGSINNLSLEATPSSGTFEAISGDTILTVTDSSTIDQNLSTVSTPTFTNLNLSATKDQLVFQSGGPTGTLTWTPAGSAKTITFPDATGEVSLLGQKISNSELDNSKITVSAGTNLTGGGDVSLGGSVTVSLKDSVSLSGTLAVSGATTLSSTLAVTGASTLTGKVTTEGILSATGNVGIGWTASTTPTFPSLGLAVAGNVGIGTTSPDFALHVTGNAGVGSSLNVTSGATFSSFANLTSVLGAGLTNCSGVTADKLLYTSSTGQFSCGTDQGGSTAAAGWTDFGTTVGLSTLTDNVGIGTSPSVASAKLHLQGAGNSTGLNLYTVNNANTVQGLVVLDNGNVGIGTTNVDYNLKVTGTGLYTGFVGIGSSLSVTGNVGIGGSLTATGLDYASGGLRVNGLSDLTGNVGIGGSLT